MFKDKYPRISIRIGIDFKPFLLLIFRYAVPDIPYSIGASVTQEELNTFVNALLQENDDAKRSKPIDFEFIVLNEFLR